MFLCSIKKKYLYVIYNIPRRVSSTKNDLTTEVTIKIRQTNNNNIRIIILITSQTSLIKSNLSLFFFFITRNLSTRIILSISQPIKLPICLNSR